MIILQRKYNRVLVHFLMATWPFELDILDIRWRLARFLRNNGDLSKQRKEGFG